MDFKLNEPIEHLSAEEALEERRRIAFLTDLNRFSIDPETRALIAARERDLGEHADSLMKETPNAS